MKTLAAVAIALMVFAGNVAQADEGRDLAGQKVVESKEVKAQRAKDRKDHDKYLKEIARR